MQPAEQQLGIVRVVRQLIARLRGEQPRDAAEIVVLEIQEQAFAIGEVLYRPGLRPGPWPEREQRAQRER